MSKASKLSRMRNTVLESTGLKYNTSGETVELNFFPDSTDSGVSVPLVLRGSTGVCAATNIPPLLGYPYAHIVDSKPYTIKGGRFESAGSAGSTSNFQLLGGNNSTTQYFRSRTFTERIIDEIGVSMVEAPDTGSDTGGPGTFLNFPTGTYYLSGSAPANLTKRNVLFWCNYTKASVESLSGRTPYLKYPLGIRGYASTTQSSSQIRALIDGRFTVTSSDDSYLLLHGTENTIDINGFGVDGETSGVNYYQPVDNIFSELKIWKIG